jgi:hypothetical protein
MSNFARDLGIKAGLAKRAATLGEAPDMSVMERALPGITEGMKGGRRSRWVGGAVLKDPQGRVIRSVGKLRGAKPEPVRTGWTPYRVGGLTAMRPPTGMEAAIQEAGGMSTRQARDAAARRRGLVIGQSGFTPGAQPATAPTRQRFNIRDLVRQLLQLFGLLGPRA